MSTISTAKEQLAALAALEDTSVVSENASLEKAVMDGFDGEPPTVLERAYVKPSGVREQEQSAREEVRALEETLSTLVPADGQAVADRIALIQKSLVTNFDKLGLALAEKYPGYAPKPPENQTTFADASKGPETNFLTDPNNGPTIT